MKTERHAYQVYLSSDAYRILVSQRAFRLGKSISKYIRDLITSDIDRDLEERKAQGKSDG